MEPGLSSHQVRGRLTHSRYGILANQVPPEHEKAQDSMDTIITYRPAPCGDAPDALRPARALAVRQGHGQGAAALAGAPAACRCAGGAPDARAGEARL